VPTDELYDVRLTVNGQCVERRVEGRRSLADFLRHDLHLRGTHVGCTIRSLPITPDQVWRWLQPSETQRR
jgi:hypothetical protein